jgi:hypothetical protein
VTSRKRGSVWCGHVGGWNRQLTGYGTDGAYRRREWAAIMPPARNYPLGTGQILIVPSAFAAAIL